MFIAGWVLAKREWLTKGLRFICAAVFQFTSSPLPAASTTRQSHLSRLVFVPTLSQFNRRVRMAHGKCRAAQLPPWHASLDIEPLEDQSFLDMTYSFLENPIGHRTGLVQQSTV
jgi:hypothetical protein